MSERPPRWKAVLGPPRRVFIALLAFVVVVTTVFGATAGDGRDPTASGGRAGATTVPFFPTSVETADGTWAAVPMGHLDEPLNTFWQLFFLPRGGSSFVNEASHLGVATNGGLVLASGGAEQSGPLLVGTRPSHLLTYSALVSTADAHSWSPVAPVSGDALAIANAPDGEHLAVVASRSGTRLMTSSHTGSTGWTTLASAASIGASAAGRACEPSALTAVATTGSGAVLAGASCSREGVAGVFVEHGGEWRRAGPNLPSADRVAFASVLSLRNAAGTTVGLFALKSGAREQLVAGWSKEPGSTAWSLSAPLSLGPSNRVVSIGPAGTRAGSFVLTAGPAGERLFLPGQNLRWRSLPPPPPGTSTVAFSAAGRVDALAVSDVVMTDWTLPRGASRWVRRRATRVDIIFGSSK